MQAKNQKYSCCWQALDSRACVMNALKSFEKKEKALEGWMAAEWLWDAIAIGDAKSEWDTIITPNNMEII